MPSSERGPGARHLAFLLSIWRDQDEGPWRAALRPADGGARLGFAGLEQLVAFLLRLDDERNSPPGREPDGDRRASSNDAQ